jgi:alpha-tubulin suppressor-like RCC1 family protein
VAGLTNVRAISAGADYACALRADGTVACWGESETGQLGNGTTTYSLVPVAVSGLTGAVAISAGSSSACAVLSDGTVACWGDNGNGELGDGTLGGISPTPVAISGLTGVTSVSVGGGFACALRSDGTVACWGYNNVGQLGIGTIDTTVSPATVSNLAGVTAISAGGAEACAVRADGTVSCWGSGTAGQLGTGTCLGSDPCIYNQPCASTPVAVAGLSGAIAVSVGAVSSCALLSSGGVECWGQNDEGELGISDASGPETCGLVAASTEPLPAVGLSQATSVAVSDSAFGRFACAVLASGGLACWGVNDAGQFGDGTQVDSASPLAAATATAPLPPLLTGVTAIAAGMGTSASTSGDQGVSCALLADGTVDCWGDNRYGDLGNGSSGNSATPVPVNGLSNATSISIGDDFACARLSTGAVKCWGFGANGELGNGSTANSSTPVAVSNITGALFVSAGSAGAGEGSACALLSDHTVACWGNNDYGQLGVPTSTISSSVPIPLPNLTGVESIAVGGLTSCALSTGGNVSCWGLDASGPTPLAVPGLQGSVTAISAGPSSACALLADGSVTCWGLATATAPMSGVPSLTNATAIAVGDIACALLSDGTQTCWEPGATGNLAPQNLTGVTAISTAVQFACALLTGGTVACWGQNRSGELGNGNTFAAPLAVPVIR